MLGWAVAVNPALLQRGSAFRSSSSHPGTTGDGEIVYEDVEAAENGWVWNRR